MLMFYNAICEKNAPYTYLRGDVKKSIKGIFSKFANCGGTVTRRSWWVACRFQIVSERGKSAQHRAMRFLTGRGPKGSASAEENDRPNHGG